MTAAATEIRLIQIARRALGLDDATYRAMLAGQAGGKTSSKALTDAERQKVLRHLKASGFVVKPKVPVPGQGWRREPQMRKLRAMWYALADVRAVERPADPAACDAAIEAWAKRLLADSPLGALDAMRFASGAQMDKAIEALKAWGRRVGADVT